MFIAKLKDVTKEWNGKPIFERVSFDVREGERLALFGRNGVGKTTLLGIVRGTIEPDGGLVQRFVADEGWGWLEQHPSVPEGETTIGYVLGARPELAAAREDLRRREEELAAASASGDAEAASEAAVRYGAAIEAYEASGGYAWETEAERALRKVGLPPETWELPYASLSGGQRTRAAIARLAARRPKVLALDEPTNHLDAETIDWLQRWVRGYPGTVIVVSHDRAFLDAAVDRVVELTPTGVKSYKGNYKAFREQKELERKTQLALYRKQEQEREEILESIRMYRQWYEMASRDAAKAAGPSKPYYAARANKHTARYHAKERELERLERNRVEKPRDAEQLRVTFRDGAFEARTLLQATDVAFAFDGQPKPLFKGGFLTLRRGDKVAVVGPNGAGKTTLLRLLIGELEPTSGDVVRHPELRVGYFSQQLEHLNREETVLDSLLRVPGMTTSFARTILGCFLFPGDTVFQRIGELSMGELCRVAFLQLYFSGANLLVLDEPTNYLDIDTRERMEEALAAYPGALVAVSHDRYFLRAVTSRVVELCGDGTWTVFDGAFAEYESDGSRRGRGRTEEERKREEALRLAELERAALMSKPELDDDDRAKLAALQREAAASTGGRDGPIPPPHEPAEHVKVKDE